MKIFNFRFRAITQAEVIIALVILSLVILASKNITSNKMNYVKRVKARVAYQAVVDFGKEAALKGFDVENNHLNFIPPYYTPSSVTMNVSAKGGLLNSLSVLNTLKDTVGLNNFECINSTCASKGYFYDVPPTLTLSNGMSMYISDRAYSYGMMNVNLTSIPNDFSDKLLPLEFIEVTSTGTTDRKLEALNSICTPFPAGADITAKNIADVRSTFSSGAGQFFANVVECPWCSLGIAVSRYESLPIFQFLYAFQYGGGTKDKNFTLGTCPNKSISTYIDKTWSRFINGSYYQIFIDTDGPKAGSNTLDDDVLEFYLTLSGNVIPVSEIRLFAAGRTYLYANMRDENNVLQPNSPFPLIRVMCHYNYGAGTNNSYYGLEENLDNIETVADRFNIIPIRGVCVADSVVCNNCKEPELVKLTLPAKARK